MTINPKPAIIILMKTESDRVEKFINEKWDAISNANKLTNNISRRLFDDVQLALSKIEGRLKFALGESFDKTPLIEDDFTRNTIGETKELVNETRQILTDIMSDLRDGGNNLFETDE